MDATHWIDLDAASATPLRPEVRAAMEPFWSEEYGNPSSIHARGRSARTALDRATDRLAHLLGRSHRDVVFTGGATEAVNLAILGTLAPGDHLVVSALEHHAALRTAEAHAARGGTVTVVAPDTHGLVHPEAVAAACMSATRLVAVMAANNEIGTVQPIAEIAAILPTHAQLVCDATQAVGALPLAPLAAAAPYFIVSPAKVGGPKGVGALVAPADAPLVPIIHGGGQQHRKRSGTENVPSIIGMVEAVVLAEAERPVAAVRLAGLRDRLMATLRNAYPHMTLHGHASLRLPGTLHVGFPGVDAEALVLKLDQLGVGCSSGAACTAPMVEPSHVLEALGLPPELVRTGVRFSLPRGITEADVDSAAHRILQALAALTRG